MKPVVIVAGVGFGIGTSVARAFGANEGVEIHFTDGAPASGG
jgi:hypothetical protein